MANVAKSICNFVADPNDEALFQGADGIFPVGGGQVFDVVNESVIDRLPRHFFTAEASVAYDPKVGYEWIEWIHS